MSPEIIRKRDDHGAFCAIPETAESAIHPCYKLGEALSVAAIVPIGIIAIPEGLHQLASFILGRIAMASDVQISELVDRSLLDGNARMPGDEGARGLPGAKLSRNNDEFGRNVEPSGERCGLSQSLFG